MSQSISDPDISQLAQITADLRLFTHDEHGPFTDQGLRPVTIAHAVNARPYRDDATGSGAKNSIYKLGGKPFRYIVTIANVSEVNRHPGRIEIQLFDETASITAKAWGTDDELTFYDLDFTPLEYVHIVGELSTFGGCNSIKISSIRRLEDASEIEYHIASVLWTIQLLTEIQPGDIIDDPNPIPTVTDDWGASEERSLEGDSIVLSDSGDEESEHFTDADDGLDGDREDSSDSPDPSPPRTLTPPPSSLPGFNDSWVTMRTPGRARGTPRRAERRRSPSEESIRNTGPAVPSMFDKNPRPPERFGTPGTVSTGSPSKGSRAPLHRAAFSLTPFLKRTATKDIPRLSPSPSPPISISTATAPTPVLTDPSGKVASMRRVGKLIRGYLILHQDVEEGCHVEDIVMEVCNQLQPRGYVVTSEAVLAALDNFADEGYIYETYDDVHYRWTETD